MLSANGWLDPPGWLKSADFLYRDEISYPSLRPPNLPRQACVKCGDPRQGPTINAQNMKRRCNATCVISPPGAIPHLFLIYILYTLCCRLIFVVFR